MLMSSSVYMSLSACKRLGTIKRDMLDLRPDWAICAWSLRVPSGVYELDKQRQMGWCSHGSEAELWHPKEEVRLLVSSVDCEPSPTLSLASSSHIDLFICHIDLPQPLSLSATYRVVCQLLALPVCQATSCGSTLGAHLFHNHSCLFSQFSPNHADRPSQNDILLSFRSV